MLFIILAILVIVVFILSIKLSNLEVKYLGETSSLKITLKEKEKEIERLKDKTQYTKNMNNDVEV